MTGLDDATGQRRRVGVVGLPPAWATSLILTASAIGLYYLPVFGPGARAAVYLTIEAAAVLAVFWTALRRPHARRTGWALIGIGMALILAGDAVWYWEVMVAQSAPSPSPADALYLAEYPFLVMGAILLVRGRPQAGVILDALIASAGAGLVVWEFVIRPSLAATDSPDAALLAAAYPVADIALIALAVGLVIGTGLPSTSLRLLAAGFMLTFVADVLNLRLTLVSDLPEPSPLDGLWLFAMGLWMAAALHPSTNLRVWHAPADWRRPRIANVALLAASALLVPLSLLGLALLGEEPDVPVIAAAWTAMVVVTAYRVVGVTAAIRRSEDRFQAVFEGSPLAMAVVRGQQVILANAAARTMLGDPDGVVIEARQTEDLMDADEGPAVLAQLSGDTPSTVETAGRRVDGEAFPMVAHGRRLELSDGAATALFLEDVTAERAAAEALAASERRYRDLFEGNPQPMWVYDLETLAFLAVNDAAVAKYGWSHDEFASMTIADIRPASEVPALLANVAQHTNELHQTGPWTHLRKDGSALEVEVTSHRVAWGGRPARLVLASDVTGRRALEEQLRQSQKMEAVGRLAGGVAHDFNNLLTAILGYGDMLRLGIEAGDPSAADLDEILRAAGRAAELTGQLLAFSRQQVLRETVVDLNAAVEDARALLSRVIGEDVSVRTELEPGLPAVRVDPVQVTQVLLNLAVNARDAMPRGGTLTIRTGSVWLDDAFADAHPGIRPGPHVVLAVADTGTGMDAETLNHAFEPFFTTKPVGQGTGLGLATVFGIVTQSGGCVSVASELGSGSTFTIHLPVAEAAVTAAGDAARRAQPPSATGQTILLVEDDPGVRRLAERILGSSGYTVVAVSDPRRAQATAATTPIDLLLTDVVMPGGDGRELAEAIRRDRPGVRILLMSGYPRGTRPDLDPSAASGIGSDEPFIEKPFTAERLLRTVSEVLATSR